MARVMKKTLVVICACLLAMVSVGHADVVLVENDFDGSASTGPAFQFLSNNSGAAAVQGSGDPSTGEASSTSFNTSSVGFNNVSTVDVAAVPGSAGFTVEWVIDSVVNSDNIEFNGFFLGVVSGASATGSGAGSLFNNNPAAIGVRLLNGDFQFVEDPETGGAQNSTPLSQTSPTTATLEDGFTVTFTVNQDDTWTASSSGLSTDFSANGMLVGVTTNYASIADDLGANVSIQGNDIDLSVGSVSLTAVSIVPEPSSIWVVGLGAIALLQRRNRR